MQRKKAAIEREGDRYRVAWEEAVSAREVGKLDVEKIKRLIFDTYTYFYIYREYNSVLREDLPVLRYASQFSVEWWAQPEDCERWEYEACIDFARGLCRAVETGFKRGYFRVSLPLGLSPYISVDGAASEADMSSYAGYEKCFKKMIEDLKRSYSQDEKDQK